MAIHQLLLQELDHEIKTIRSTVERLPEDKLDWAPHAKSMKLGPLAAHLAELLFWGTSTIEQDDVDLAPPGGEPMKPFQPTSLQEILDRLEQNAASFRQKLATCDDEAMARTWRLLNGGKVLLAMPRYVALRSFVLNHAVHHRAQLGVYLRLLDVPVPSVYGPSADENPQRAAG